MTYNVFGGTLSLTQSINQSIIGFVASIGDFAFCFWYFKLTS